MPAPIPPQPEHHPLLWPLRLQAVIRLPIIALSGVFCVLLILLFYLCGTFNPPAMPFWSEADRVQLLGASLLHSTVPPYLLLTMLYSIRLAEKTLARLQPHFNYDEAAHNQWSQSFSRHPRRPLILGTILGIVLSLMLAGDALKHLHPVSISMLLGNMLLWSMVMQGVLITTRNAYLFTKLARAHLQIKLSNLEALTPFMGVGIQGTLLVVGALALMPLQAIDIQFRLMNHLPGIIVGLPMIGILLILPVWGVHQRIVAEKNAEIARIQALLDTHQRPERTNYEDIAQLSTLMSYKRELKALPTWPIELPDMYRLAFYMVIPPLSWISSALIQHWFT
ncbi:MAG: hypothetical protein AAF512_23695 [Pseudomonadota bacterium]